VPPPQSQEEKEQAERKKRKRKSKRKSVGESLEEFLPKSSLPATKLWVNCWESQEEIEKATQSSQ
jgi:hypothetical protein